MELKELRIALKGISTYRSICKEPLMMQVFALLDAVVSGRGEDALEHYTEVFYLLRQAGYSGLGGWLEDKLKYSEEAYPLLVERGDRDAVLEAAACRDVEAFMQLAGLDCEILIGAMQKGLTEEYRPLLARLPRWEGGASFDFEGVTAFYRKNGTGLFARYRAFLWEAGELFPIAKPDAPEKHELLGYELQREVVIANTRAMLEGHTVNNVLLYGDSGTGKSATVKSLLALEGFEDLRIIELQKDGLADMPKLVRHLRDRRQKFILFIDDLAFDQDDRTYSLLKTILEGGLEPRPANVAIYATSNRRHLIKETWNDRSDMEHNGDIHRSDTLEEKLSLANRFGLAINFSSPNRKQYHDIVKTLADRAGVIMDEAEMFRKADAWEIRHGGVSGRAAQQFINDLICTQKN